MFFLSFSSASVLSHGQVMNNWNLANFTFCHLLNILKENREVVKKTPSNSAMIFFLFPPHLWNNFFSVGKLRLCEWLFIISLRVKSQRSCRLVWRSRKIRSYLVWAWLLVGFKRNWWLLTKICFLVKPACVSFWVRVKLLFSFPMKDIIWMTFLLELLWCSV